MLSSLITAYGYWAVLIGTFLEGETILVLGGFAAQAGDLELSKVILVAFTGSFFGDQLYFFLGRKHSQAILSKRPAWKERIEVADRMLHRYHTLVILTFRFLYGFRIVLPFAIGMSSVSARKFVILNAIGATIWAVAVGGCGYLFGHAVRIVIGNIKHYELEAMGLIVVVALCFWLRQIWRRRKHPLVLK